jgi:hypothetical protein
VFLAESYFIKSIEENEERDKCTLIEKGMLMFEKKTGGKSTWILLFLL